MFTSRTSFTLADEQCADAAALYIIISTRVTAEKETLHARVGPYSVAVATVASKGGLFVDMIVQE